MEIVSLVFLFLLGIFFLYIGAEGLVRGSVQISHMLGISPIIMGLTVVAFGTSAPEFAVSLVAVIQNSRDIAIGNIIGSNIANIGLIIGLSAIFKPLIVNKRVLLKEAPFLIFTAVLIFFLFMDLELSSLEGFLLLILMLGFLTYMIRIATKEHAAAKEFMIPEEEIKPYIEQYDVSVVKHIYHKIHYSRSYFVHSMVVLAGIIMLTLGSNWLIHASKELGRLLGISDVVIGMSVVAVGTSLPELATSLVSAIKKEADISIGNIIGSNIFNTFFVLGIVGAVHPVAISWHVAFVMVPIMIGFTVVFVIFMYTGKKIVRWEAALLFACYMIFLNYLYL